MALEEYEHFLCPYCGRSNTLFVDVTAGSQKLTVDCEICCAPIVVRLKVSGGNVVRIDIDKENG
jgi:transcription elongation factor Elf1